MNPIPLVPGARFGPFRIVEPLGRGGMAAVWKAHEIALDRFVALKVLPGEFLHDADFGARFQREARLVARLEHPHILPIFAFGIEGGVPWMSTRLIDGGSLAAALGSGPLPIGRALAVVRAVAEALDYAHDAGVVHRDVKPQNILLTSGGHVVLADFGIARMVEGDAAITRTGLMSGTPQYMAPEYATGGILDRRADVYALGIVAYEMLTGAAPFLADTPVAVLFKQVSEPIPIPPRDRVPEALLGPVLKCLEKKAEDRWPTATAFAEALEAGWGAALAAETAPAVEVATAPTLRLARPDPGAEGSPAGDAPIPRAGAARAPGRSRRWLVPAGGALLLALLLGVAVTGRGRLFGPGSAPGAASGPPAGPARSTTAPPSGSAARTPPRALAPAQGEAPAGAPAKAAGTPRSPADAAGAGSGGVGPRAKPAPGAGVSEVRTAVSPGQAAETVGGPGTMVGGGVGDAAADPRPVPSPGRPFQIGRRIDLAGESAGPVTALAIEFRVARGEALQALLEVDCAQGKDQLLTWEITFRDERGALVASLQATSDLDEGDRATVKKRVPLGAEAIGRVRSFRLAMTSADD